MCLNIQSVHLQKLGQVLQLPRPTSLLSILVELMTPGFQSSPASHTPVSPLSSVRHINLQTNLETSLSLHGLTPVWCSNSLNQKQIFQMGQSLTIFSKEG